MILHKQTLSFVFAIPHDDTIGYPYTAQRLCIVCGMMFRLFPRASQPLVGETLPKLRQVGGHYLGLVRPIIAHNGSLT
jgi:hypothetical protein